MTTFFVNNKATHNFLLSLDTVICYLQPQDRQSASEMNSEKWNTNTKTNTKHIQNDGQGNDPRK